MKNTNQKITDKQLEILIFLYRFRYLNRSQIQKLMCHKNHMRILSWLNELKDIKLIKSTFDKKLAASPAVYSLDTEGRKYLRKNADKNTVDSSLLSRGWRDKNHTEEFKAHCMFTADIYLSLLEQYKDDKTEFKFFTKSDLYGMVGIINPGPDAFYSVKENGRDTIRYFLEIFDDIAPVYIRKRVKEYFEYYSSDEWQDNTGTDFPLVTYICPNKRIKSHLYYYIQNKIRDDEPSIYLATKELFLSVGLKPDVLEKVMEKE